MNALTRPEPTPWRSPWPSLLLALWLGACTSLPPRAPDAAAPAALSLVDSPLARLAADSTPPSKRHLSGLRLLPSGEHAFDARVALARQATQTLDAQYYTLADDATGRRFVRELRDAAARGVRVRLLLDDLHSGEAVDLLAGLATQAGVEVRLFNPLPVRIGSPLARLTLSANQFDRLNRRMHNKLFIADGRIAISGGRNIGDEYFMRSHSANFVDLDLLCTGPVLNALNESFEQYWHSPFAYPLKRLQAAGSDEGTMRKRFEQQMQALAPLPMSLARDSLGNSPISAQIEQGHLELLFAPMQVLADTPHKVDRGGTLDDSALGQGLGWLREARSEVIIVSPYFIPGVRGMAMIRGATGAKVRVSVLTNSMSATDEPMVHRAYAGYRMALLDLGVTIHELGPGLARKAGVFGDFRSSDGRLHAKVAVADRRWVLMGSMNMDGRSALANTELGLLIDSPALAWELRSLWRRAHVSSSYTLRRAGNGIEWVTRGGPTEVVQRDEPGANWATRFTTGLLSFLVTEELL